MWGSFTLVGTLAYGSGRRRAIETKCGARLAEITFVGNFLRIDKEVKSLLPARAACPCWSRDSARKANFAYAATICCYSSLSRYYIRETSSMHTFCIVFYDELFCYLNPEIRRGKGNLQPNNIIQNGTVPKNLIYFTYQVRN